MPSDLQIDLNPHYRQAVWRLEHQLNTADDLIFFWKIVGRFPR